MLILFEKNPNKNNKNTKDGASGFVFHPDHLGQVGISKDD